MTALVYQDFDLSIEANSFSDPSRYRVRAYSLSAGQVSTEFTLPFSAQDLERLFLWLGRPRRGVRAIGSPEMKAAQAFGSQLFATVFTGPVQRALVSSLAIARQQGQGLRIRLRLHDVPELADLPWEFLYDPTQSHFLAYSTVTPLVRYLDLPQTVAPLAVQSPLKVLVMIANPRDHGYSTLNVEDEWRKVQGALAGLEERGLVQVARLESATLSALQRQLRRNQYHIFHFVGHGGFDQQSQNGVLLLEDEQGRTRPLNGHYLGALLRDHFPLRLALLNACEGQRTSRADPFAGVAQHLVQQGIPAVIAMQFEITDRAAMTLFQEFYSALADNYSVDAALSEARKSLYTAGNDIEWGTPALYLGVQSGQLFEVQSPSTIQFEADAARLASVNSVEDIRNVYRNLAIGDLAEPLSALLRRFSRISQDVDVALQQESPYNQRQALNGIEERLASLLKELDRSKVAYALRFYRIATQWRQIIAHYSQELARISKLQQEIDSPYITGIPLTKWQEIFKGRRDNVIRLEQLLADRRRPPLLLYGQRRMGKTSLLLNLGRMLRTTIVPLFVDLQGAPSQANDHAGFLYNLARTMIDSANEQRQMLLPPLRRDELVQDPFTRFNEWLDEVEKVLGQNTALLLLDEFEALDHAFDENRFDPVRVLGMLRHLIQHRPRFKVLLAGSHTLDELQRWSSYLINVQVVQVGYLKEAEARQLVEQPVADFTLRYEPAASQRVLDLTRGHPFLVQLLCEEIVALKNEQEPAQRRLARLTDVEAAVPEALDHGRLFFSDIQQNQIDQVGVDLLIYLAAQGAGAALSRQALEKQAPQQNGFGHSLDLLLQRDLIEAADNGYRFQVELIRRWFAQQASTQTQPVSQPSLFKRITQGLFVRNG